MAEDFYHCTSDNTPRHAMYENYETIVLPFRRWSSLEDGKFFFLLAKFNFLPSLWMEINLIKSTKLTFLVVSFQSLQLAGGLNEQFFHECACRITASKVHREVITGLNPRQSSSHILFDVDVAFQIIWGRIVFNLQNSVLFELRSIIFCLSHMKIIGEKNYFKLNHI